VILTLYLGFIALFFSRESILRHDYSVLAYLLWAVCGGFGLLGLLTSAPRIHPDDFRLRRSETVFLALV
jgi:hypothetical protein